MNNIYRPDINKKILEQLYITRDLSLFQCSLELECSSSLILNRMRKFGIPRRPASRRKFNILKNLRSDVLNLIKDEDLKDQVNSIFHNFEKNNYIKTVSRK